jgi:hypothetical protein
MGAGWRAALAVAAIVATACGGGGGDAPTPETAAPTVELSGAAREIHRLLGDMQAAEFYVLYEIRTAEEPGERVERRAIYHAGDRTRIDVLRSDGSVVSTLIGTGEGHAAVACEGGPDDWQCVRIDDFGGPVLQTAAPITFFSARALASYDVAATEDREIAGEPARCFEVRAGDDEAITNCFSDDGVLLHASPTFGWVEAVEFALGVPAGTFEPPADP